MSLKSLDMTLTQLPYHVSLQCCASFSHQASLLYKRMCLYWIVLKSVCFDNLVVMKPVEIFIVSQAYCVQDVMSFITASSSILKILFHVFHWFRTLESRAWWKSFALN